MPSPPNLSADRPPILFIHGSLSSGQMWASFVPYIGETRKAVAPDLLGYGASPPWSGGGGFRLRDEARPLWDRVGGRIDIVAHSYGAAVALSMLVEAPERVRSLMLIEPCCFFLLDDLGPGVAEVRRDIALLPEQMRERLASGDAAGAAALFVDYWNGPGAFAAMSDGRRAALASRIGKVVCDFDAVAAERIRLDGLRTLPAPALVVMGDSGPQAPRLIGSAIARTMPNGAAVRMPGAGHMLPLTHGRELGPLLGRWLADRTAA